MSPNGHLLASTFMTDHMYFCETGYLKDVITGTEVRKYRRELANPKRSLSLQAKCIYVHTEGLSTSGRTNS